MNRRGLFLLALFGLLALTFVVRDSHGMDWFWSLFRRESRRPYRMPVEIEMQTIAASPGVTLAAPDQTKSLELPFPRRRVRFVESSRHESSNEGDATLSIGGELAAAPGSPGMGEFSPPPGTPGPAATPIPYEGYVSSIPPYACYHPTPEEYEAFMAERRARHAYVLSPAYVRARHDLIARRQRFTRQQGLEPEVETWQLIFHAPPVRDDPELYHVDWYGMKQDMTQLYHSQHNRRRRGGRKAIIWMRHMEESGVPRQLLNPVNPRLDVYAWMIKDAQTKIWRPNDQPTRWQSVDEVIAAFEREQMLQGRARLGPFGGKRQPFETFPN